MKTEELINALTADSRRRPLAMGTAWWMALALAVFATAAIFFNTIGPRPDVAEAASSFRFLFKFVVTICLAATALAAVGALSRPDVSPRRVLPWLALAPALLLLAVAVELLVVPADTVSMLMVGKNSSVCLTFIPLVGIGPLAVFVAVLRHGAPSRPGAAGAAAGLLAGGIAATFYAAHCTDDSPLFVATWYTVGIAGLSLLGAAASMRLARW